MEFFLNTPFRIGKNKNNQNYENYEMIGEKSPVEAAGKINQDEITHQKNEERQQQGRIDESDGQKIDGPKQFQNQKRKDQGNKTLVMDNQRRRMTGRPEKIETFLEKQVNRQKKQNIDE